MVFETVLFVWSMRNQHWDADDVARIRLGKPTSTFGGFSFLLENQFPGFMKGRKRLVSYRESFQLAVDLTSRLRKALTRIFRSRKWMRNAGWLGMLSGFPEQGSRSKSDKQ